ncbi:uncharacterized protein B0I36DRAFT_10674 [Microdochium trichocladiopsis]|uniref:GET complex subunit GET2 n=1 Tax=Microdochium trichocladiopsis TaxID=1682393 RepID=A0A9P8YHF9_9PEZI|nr:uncharacterized protein B0I36DRAFT_10674 [Microdochium trichocladiopsis]KAH7040459.1 hypothetical protein B0I36DRAFT_10674 [Microdochium trichocladiopsis]
MTETVQAPEDAAAARAAEQARLRKERREAKIKAGGSARLNKITGLGGGIPRDAPVQSAPSPAPSTATTTQTSTPQATPAAASSHDADPAEVDISQHFYKPETTARIPSDPSNLSENQLRQLMLGMDPSSAAGPQPQNPFSPAGGASMPPGMEGLQDDPIMKLMSQMMSGGMPGAEGGQNPFAGTPLDGLFGSLGGLDGGAAAGGAGPAANSPFAQAQQAVAQKTTNLWRILHAVFAIGLGLYVALSTTFTGTHAEREDGTIESTGFFGARSVDETKAYFFYLFTSIEAVLLTSRFFLDKDRAPPTGWAWTISGFLPGQVQSYLRQALQYGRILSTIRSDALVCVFVLGVCVWLRS